MHEIIIKTERKKTMKQGILLLTVGVMLLAGCSSVPTKDI
jgi:hypothetical protein